MTDATKRSIHIVFAIPIIGYIYSCSVCRLSWNCAFGALDVETPSRSTTYFENSLDVLSNTDNKQMITSIHTLIYSDGPFTQCILSC